MKTVLRFIITAIVLIGSAYGDDSAEKKLEAKYLSTLDSWVKRGGPVNEIQETVVQTCGKLVMLTADTSEKLTLATTQREEFDFRVDVCTKMIVNRVYPQPEFEKKEIVTVICDESKVVLFHKL